DAGSSARSAGAADRRRVRRSVSLDLGRAARRGDPKPARGGRRPMTAPPGRRATVLAAQAALGVAILALWQTLVSVRVLDPFLVSRPSATAGPSGHVSLR